MCTVPVLEKPLRQLGSNCLRGIILVRKGYRNLSLPEQLYLELEEFVEKSKGRYLSVAEVTREAIREFLQKHQ
jgi:hypothetical protein